MLPVPDTNIVMEVCYCKKLGFSFSSFFWGGCYIARNACTHARVFVCFVCVSVSIFYVIAAVLPCLFTFWLVATLTAVVQLVR